MLPEPFSTGGPYPTQVQVHYFPNAFMSESVPTTFRDIPEPLNASWHKEKTDHGNQLETGLAVRFGATQLRFGCSSYYLDSWKRSKGDIDGLDEGAREFLLKRFWRYLGAM